MEVSTASIAVPAWRDGGFWRAVAIEIAAVATLLGAYKLGRTVSRDHVAIAFDHADQVMAFERRLGVANEEALQALMLPHRWAIWICNRYYTSVHFPTTIVFLVASFLRGRDRHRDVRRVFTAVTAAGLVLHVGYPLAPPRMLAGFVDTVQVYGPSIYDRPGVEGIANQYAAMPSLHVGWALIVAWGMWRWGRSWGWVGVAHAVATSVVVVLTANHWWVDGLVAGALVAGAIAIVRRWGEPLTPPPAGRLRTDAPAS